MFASPQPILGPERETDFAEFLPSTSGRFGGHVSQIGISKKLQKSTLPPETWRHPWCLTICHQPIV
jgi:hypothetical protein